MSAEFKPYQPVVPEETVGFFGHEVEGWDWYPYPSRSFWNTEKIDPDQLLDTVEGVISLTGQYRLQGSLEDIDLTVGCRWPCQTCIRDSQALSAIMPLEAAQKIIHNPHFYDLLPEWSLCIGFTAEPSDNPHVVEIVESILATTASKKDGFRINLKTNFRQQKEDLLCQLMSLTNTSGRLILTISLPLNRDNRIQDDFKVFKQRNRGLFNDHMVIFDLKNPLWQEIENLGRVLPGAKDTGLAELETYESRGQAGLILNPEGLWMAVNTTRYEAHTPEIYTPVTIENAGWIGTYMRHMRHAGNDYFQAKSSKLWNEKYGTKFPQRLG